MLAKLINKYSLNVSWMVSGRMVSTVVNLFVGVWVVRYLGPEQFGILSFAMGIAPLFMMITNLGLENVVIRELAKEEEAHDIILGSVFVLRLFAFVLMFCLLFIMVNFADYDALTTSLIFILASGSLFQSVMGIQMYYFAQVRARYVVQSQLAGLFVCSAIKIWLIFIEAQLLYFALMVVLDSAVIALGLYVHYRLEGRSILQWRWRVRVAIKLLKHSWPLMVAGFAITVQMKVGHVFIGEFLDAESVGQYAAAARLSEVIYILPVAIAASLYPALVKWKDISEETYRERLQKFVDVMVWSGIAMAALMSVTAEWLIVTVFGEVFKPAGQVMSIYVWTAMFVFIGVATNNWLLTEKLEKFTMYREILGAAVIIGLNILLIPMLGIIGAAIASVASKAMANYLALIIFPHTRTGFWIASRAFNPAGAMSRLYTARAV